ncbi:MAG TPA: hypothetical protein VGG44_02140 [Tepidisphaeraceae bacterium]|jgi:hypothetical protein
MDATASPPREKLIAPSPISRPNYALRAAGWLLIIGIIPIAIILGLRLRYWTFNASDPIRFISDMRHGTFWGLEASGPEGYFNQYEKMDPQVPEWQDSRWEPWLDYSPLRLLVMREWGAWQRAHHPPDPNIPLTQAWQRPYWFNAPVLNFNTVLEGLSAIFAFLLTRHWVVRGSAGEIHGHFHGIWQGLVAALLIWFSPDMIINAHGWPQWDTWIVPWYLCACLLASLDWWFAAGVAVAIGVNFKGQMFSITPIFIIWPLVQGRVGAALRWICGMTFCYALIVSGWLITYLPPALLAAARAKQVDLATPDFPPDLFVISRVIDVPAIIWIFEMLLVVAAIPWLLRTYLPDPLTTPADRWKTILHSRYTWIAASVILIFAVVFWPWLLPRNRGAWYLGCIAGVAVITSALLLPRRSQGYLLAAILGGGLFSCMALFHGTTAWWDCAVHYGSIHWPYMYIGPTSNIPAIFQIRFGWSRDIDQVAFTLPAIQRHWPSFITSRYFWPAFDFDVTAKVMFDSIYIFTLVLSGIAIGIQTRRNDRRALVAFVTPWVMFFLFPVQMQERYLLWGGAAAACCIGDSVGAALLGVMLMIFSLMMPMKILVDIGSSDLDQLGDNLSRAVPWLFSPDSGQTIKQYLDGTQPDIAWGMLIVGMAFLYLSFTKSPRASRVAAVTPSSPSSLSLQ